MVFFCCSSCGESLKKNQVNKHYMRCRMSMVSCLDCNQEFWGDDFNNHIKCISEEEKYSGKDFKPTQNKGEAKQDAWLQKVQSAIDSSKSKPHIRKYLEMLKDYPNIPRKQSKFENFVNNSLRIRDKSLVQDIWSILMTENTTSTSTTTTTTTAASKEDKNSNNGVGNSSTEMMAVEEEGNEDEGGDGGGKKNKKESKREKKAKRSEKQNKKEKKDRRKLEEEEEGKNDEDEVMECDGGDGEEKKKKKKNKKRKHEAMEIDSENSMKKKKKKKARKTEEIDEENDEKENEEINGKENVDNDEEEEEEVEEEEEEKVKKKRKSKKNIVFDWEQSIVTVLKKKQDQAMSLKKVGKKVIAEFLAQGGYAESNDKLRATFTKKVTKNPRFICVKDEVRLSKNR